MTQTARNWLKSVGELVSAQWRSAGRDTAGAAVFAYDTNDNKPAGPGKVEIADLNGKIAALLGTTADQVNLQDVAGQP